MENKWILWVIIIVIILLIVGAVFLSKNKGTKNSSLEKKTSGKTGSVVDDSELNSLSDDLNGLDDTSDLGVDDNLDSDLGF